MTNDPSLKPPVYWKMSKFILNAIQKSLNIRAENEYMLIEKGKDLSEAHGEAIRDYKYFKKYIKGGIRFLRLIGRKVEGVVADLGSGTGVCANILSLDDHISEVLAIEYSEKMVEYVMPRVFEQFHGNVKKIQRVVGDFNSIQVANDSIDLIVEIDSFHHAENLTISAKEAWRVLKPGGAIIAIDRGWNDSTTTAELDGMLDRDFSPELKIKYGISLDKKFTRRDFGEHEYIFKTWEGVFHNAGFDTVLLFQENYPHIPGINFFLTHFFGFESSILRASSKYTHGAKRLPVFGWAPQKMIFVCLKD